MEAEDDAATGPLREGAILDRLDAIGRLLAEGSGARREGAPAHLVNRIDMLAGIVGQVLEEREADEARLKALTRRVVALESGLLPALHACVERLDALLPLAAGLALEERVEGAGLALVLRDLRDTLSRLDRLASPRAPTVVPAMGPVGVGGEEAPLVDGAPDLTAPALAPQCDPEPSIPQRGDGPLDWPGDATGPGLAVALAEGRSAVVAEPSSASDAAPSGASPEPAAPLSDATPRPSCDDVTQAFPEGPIPVAPPAPDPTDEGAIRRALARAMDAAP